MTDFKPGDIAMVECSDGEWRQAVARLGPFGAPTAWVFADQAMRRLDESNARPLVVIDPEDREQVERLVRAFWDHGTDDCDDPQAMADGLRSMVEPPKPPEPTGAYAAVVDKHGSEFVRLGDGPAPWMHNGSPSNRDTYAWSGIAAVTVLSEGVTQT